MSTSRETPVALAVHDEVPAELARIVDDGLGEANACAAPIARTFYLDTFSFQAPAFHRMLG